MAWLTGWTYRKQITVQDDYVDGDLASFPLYVKIVADADMSTALATGFDVRFTLSDGTTTLYYERESWSGGGGSAVTADFWVNVPSIAATGGAVIYIYWGKAGSVDGESAVNVWDANYKCVFHLAENGGPYLDSTGQVSDARIGADPVQAAGIVGKGQDFIPTDQIQIADNDVFDFGGNSAAWEAWVRWDDLSVRRGILDRWWSTTNQFLMRCSSDNPGLWEVFCTTTGGYRGKKFSAGIDSPNLTDWQHVVAIMNGSTLSLQVNGVVSTDTLSLNAGTLASVGLPLTIGNYNLGSGPMDGRIDEVRISNSYRSTAWFKFEYRNIIEADNELTWGAIEGLTAFAPRMARQFRLGPKLVRY